MWRVKILVQAVLARLPGGQKINYMLQRLRGSAAPARLAAHAISILRELNEVNRFVRLQGARVVEIGTGWEAPGPLCLYLMGTQSICTYDHVRHLRHGMVLKFLDAVYANLDEIAAITSISRNTLLERLLQLKSASDVEALLDRAGISYMAPADAAHTGLPDKSVDLIYSREVMEHVSEDFVGPLTDECRRILRPGGMAFHAISLGDHFATKSRVNFLRYPQWLWDLLVKNKIAYQNRLREKHFVKIFRNHGAKVQIVSHEVYPEDVEILKTMRVDKRFAGMTSEELAVCWTRIAVSF